MEEDRLSNEAFSRATIAALGLHLPYHEAKLAAALERERRDPVRRSDTEKLLRRQMPVPTPAPDALSELYAAIAAPRARRGPERWFSTRRRRIRVEGLVAGGSFVILMVSSTALFYVSEVLGLVVAGVAAIAMFLALGAVVVETVQGYHAGEAENENEKAVARLVSGGGD